MGALESVTQVVSQQKALDGDLRKKVGAARKRGATWAQIGEALGTSGSAAHERFSDVVTTRPRVPRSPRSTAAA